MVWEQRSSTIVMLTNLQERHKVTNETWKIVFTIYLKPLRARGRSTGLDLFELLILASLAVQVFTTNVVRPDYVTDLRH